jgi:hypothetical protein
MSFEERNSLRIALMRIKAMNCTKSFPSTVADVCIRSRFMSREFFRSSKHFSTGGLVAVNLHGSNGIFDPVGEQRLETRVAADVLVHCLRVERNLQSALGSCILDKKVIIGLLVFGYRLARLEFALV